MTDNLLKIIISILNSFFNGFLQMILDFVMFIVSIILLPIDALLYSLIPDYVNLTSHINDFLTLASQYLGYCLDSFGFFPATITLFVSYLTVKLTLPLQTWLVKLAIKWYTTIKT